MLGINMDVITDAVKELIMVQGYHEKNNGIAPYRNSAGPFLVACSGMPSTSSSHDLNPGAYQVELLLSCKSSQREKHSASDTSVNIKVNKLK